MNGDDFGLSSGINRGIRQAYNQGILRSASLMANGPAFAEAVAIAGATPGLSVGVHLSLVGEKCAAPLSLVRGLAGEEGFLPPSHLSFLRGYLRGRFGPAQIRAEIDAQILRILDAGLVPTHIDSHQHLHLLPGVLEIVLEIARRAGISVIRIPWERSPIGGRWPQKRVLGWFSQKAARKIRAAQMRSPDHFFGFGLSGRLDERNLLRILGRLGPGVNEVMCHPGFPDGAAERHNWGYLWEAELAALCSPAVRSFIDREDIRISAFRQARLSNP